jgi:hypothetical protein
MSIQNISNYNVAKVRDLFELKCVCGNVFIQSKRVIEKAKSRNQSKLYCSLICAGISQRTKTEVVCKTCSKPFLKQPAQIKKSKNHFCSQSCFGTYNQAHKTKGTRRSKLEVYLEEQIRLRYPQYELICNGKSAINSELDFYFPTLNLAIELNGIFHYEPIYGPDKLAKTQNNDQRKFAACNYAGIALAIIDSGSSKYITKKSKDYFWIIVQTVIDKHLAT